MAALPTWCLVLQDLLHCCSSLFWELRVALSTHKQDGRANALHLVRQLHSAEQPHSSRLRKQQIWASRVLRISINVSQQGLQPHRPETALLVEGFTGLYARLLSCNFWHQPTTDARGWLTRPRACSQPALGSHAHLDAAWVC